LFLATPLQIFPAYLKFALAQVETKLAFLHLSF
jgi:hypothetical protein